MPNTPVRCSQCGAENLVDLQNLSTRPVEGNAVVEEHGFNCEHCGVWEHSHFMSTSLRNMYLELEKLPQDSAKYQKKLAKFLRKFQNLQKRVLNGIESKNMAESG